MVEVDGTASSNITITFDESSGNSKPSGIPIIEAVLFATFTAICICFTIIGNILVVMSVFTYRPLRNVPNFFIVSLSVADLAVAILVMPFNVANFCIGYWVFGSVFCNMWLTFDILTCTASILNLCAIAIDRYRAIHDPINYSQKRTFGRVMVMIALVWGLSAIISIPPLFGWNDSSGTGLYDEKTGICQLTDEKGYVIYSASGSFYIPLIIMSFVYIKIYQATRKRLRQRANAAAAARGIPVKNNKDQGTSETHENEQCEEDSSSDDTPQNSTTVTTRLNANESTVSLQGVSLTSKNLSPAQCDGTPSSSPRLKLKRSHNGTSPSDKKIDKNYHHHSSQVHKFLEEKQRISLSKERRAARTMTIIMACFICCWLPFFIMYVVLPFCASCVARTDPRVVNFVVWLGYLNSALNPVIYTVFNIDFRRAFKRLLQGNCRLRR